MFGGLELKGSNEKRRDDVKNRQSVSGTSNNNSSGFSFIQLATTESPQTVSSSVIVNPPINNSGFSFIASAPMTSSISTNNEGGQTVPVPSSSAFSFITTSDTVPSAPTSPSKGSSGFSFVASGSTSPTKSSSGFSFVGSTIISSSTNTNSLVPPSSPHNQFDFLSSVTTSTTSVQDKSRNESDKNLSIPLDFSGLVSSESKSLTEPVTSASKGGTTLCGPWGTSSLPANNTVPTLLPVKNDDILSLKNSSQPVGSGVVFGKAVTSKVSGGVKKRTRTLKVGTGANFESAPDEIVIPHLQTEASQKSSAHDDMCDNQHFDQLSVAEEENDGIDIGETPVAVRANNAVSIPLSAESSNSFEKSSFVDTPLEDINPSTVKTNERDDVYQQAMAAAKEAAVIRKHGIIPPNKSLISGLFKRSVNQGIPSASNHSTRSQSPFATADSEKGFDRQKLGNNENDRSSHSSDDIISNIRKKTEQHFPGVTNVVPFYFSYHKPLGLFADEFDDRNIKFAFVSQVKQGSFADKAGIVCDDIIVGVSGQHQHVEDVYGLGLDRVRSLIAAVPADQTLTLYIARGVDIKSRRDGDISLKLDSNGSITKEDSVKNSTAENASIDHRQSSEPAADNGGKDHRSKMLASISFRRRIETEKQKGVELEVSQQMNEQNFLPPSFVMNTLLDAFASNCDRSADQIEHVRRKKVALQAERSETRKQVKLATKRISQAEIEQAVAAESEDFDRAESLSAIIEQYASDSEKHETVLLNIEDCLKTLAAEKENVFKSVVECLTNVQSELVSFCKEQEASDKEDSEEIIDRFATESKRLSAENDRLSSDLKIIERDEKFLAEEVNELECAISSQTHELSQQRNAARQQMLTVQKEVEDLRRLLAAKEAEESELTVTVAQFEAAIAQVRSTFSRQSTRLAKKESVLKESRNEWEVELSGFKKMKERHEAEIAAHTEELVAKQSLLSRAQAEINSAAKVRDVFVSNLHLDFSELLEYDDDDELLDLQASVVTLEVTVAQANDLLLATQTAVNRIREEISDIDAKLPVLEADKKDAASKRDFKAAGKASKDIKDLTTRREVCELEFSGAAMQRLLQARTDLENATNALFEKKTAARVKEKELARQSMIRLAKKIHHLIEVTNSLSSFSKINDKATTVISTTLKIVEAEIKALRLRGEEYGKVFDGWEEILAGMAVSHNSLDSVGENHDSDDEANHSCSEVEKCIRDHDVLPCDKSKAEESREYMSKEDAIARYTEIEAILKTLDVELENAVAEEDYDTAADLQDRLQALNAELESLSLSESDINNRTETPTLIEETKTVSEVQTTPNLKSESDDAGLDEIKDLKETSVNATEDQEDETSTSSVSADSKCTSEMPIAKQNEEIGDCADDSIRSSITSA